MSYVPEFDPYTEDDFLKLEEAEQAVRGADAKMLTLGDLRGLHQLEDLDAKRLVLARQYEPALIRTESAYKEITDQMVRTVWLGADLDNKIINWRAEWERGRMQRVQQRFVTLARELVAGQVVIPTTAELTFGDNEQEDRPFASWKIPHSSWRIVVPFVEQPSELGVRLYTSGYSYDSDYEVTISGEYDPDRLFVSNAYCEMDEWMYNNASEDQSTQPTNHYTMQDLAFHGNERPKRVARNALHALARYVGDYYKF